MSEKQKKPGFFQKLFGSSKSEDDCPSPTSPTSPGGKKSPTKPPTPTSTKPPTSRQNSSNAPASPTKESGASKAIPSVRVDPPAKDKPQSKPRPKEGGGGGGGGGAAAQRKANRAKKSSRRKGNRKAAGITKVDASQPLEFPATPELILSHHKVRPFLNKNEEWLLVELNEFECLVDNIDIIKTIAKHSKFFEVEPDELWEEFFEYVEEMPSYDEVINFDVWQEFRDEKYPC